MSSPDPPFETRFKLTSRVSFFQRIDPADVPMPSVAIPNAAPKLHSARNVRTVGTINRGD